LLNDRRSLVGLEIRLFLADRIAQTNDLKNHISNYLTVLQ
jgi:hypothetical protein